MKTFFAIVGTLLLILAGAYIVLVGGNILATGASVATAPGRVVQQTMKTDNIIEKYEWFHNAWAQVQSRRSQIAAHRGIMAAETDKGELSRLRIELAAMQQSCRELSNQYNANATKTNQSIFMGREAQPSVDASACE